jgi:hypothetical protein
MKATRRSLLALAAASQAAAQANSASALRIARHGNPQRPAIALFLPGITTPSAVIEMPEHAWYRTTAESPQTWFYKMHTSDPAFRGQVAWKETPDTIAFEMQTPSGFQLNTQARLEQDGVAITHIVRTNSAPALAAVEAVTCVKLYRPFTDTFLERTYVHLPAGLDLIAADTPARTAQNAEEWLPCRYIARVGRNAPAQPYRVEKQDGITRHFKSQAADIAFLATESTPPGWTIATAARDCDSVFTNPARTCHHTDPVARNITNGQATLALKVYALKTDPHAAYTQVAKAWN